MNQTLELLMKNYGLTFSEKPPTGILDETIAMDAQPTLITQSNAGILAFLSTEIDPKIIDVLVAPMKATEIVGSEVRKGDWTLANTMFPLAENTGEVSSYGDFSTNGRSGANVNWEPRQSYHYQTITQWGEKELEMYGRAKIDWAARQNVASVMNLNKYQNLTYFFGVAGLQLYGLLNDPSLLPAIAPPQNAAGGVGWGTGSTAVALDVVNGIRALFGQLVSQANGLVDRNTKMTLAMSPLTDAEAMTLTVTFGLNVADFLKKDFPNMTVKSAPEYATASGNLVQLIVDEYENQPTAQTAFTEKLRAHPIIIAESSFKQKKSQGTWGTIIYRPVFIAQMIGV